MKWYLFKKYFRGGNSKTFCLCVGEDDAEGRAKLWAENSDGGQESGYRVEWEPKKPSRKEANELIAQKIKEVMNLTAEISEINKEIAEAGKFVREKTKPKEEEET